MPEAIRKNLPSAVSASLLSILVVVVAWIFAGGRMTGATSSDLAALQERQSRLEERQTRLEALVSDRLERIMSSQGELRTAIETMRAEERLLHRGQFAGVAR